MAPNEYDFMTRYFFVWSLRWTLFVLAVGVVLSGLGAWILNESPSAGVRASLFTLLVGGPLILGWRYASKRFVENAHGADD